MQEFATREGQRIDETHVYSDEALSGKAAPQRARATRDCSMRRTPGSSARSFSTSSAD